MNNKEQVACWLLNTTANDLEFLFYKMDSDLLQESIDSMKEDKNQCVCVENLWTECVINAAEKVFGNDSNRIYCVYNCIDSRIFITENDAKEIENFSEKKEKFEKIMAYDIEILE